MVKIKPASHKHALSTPTVHNYTRNNLLFIQLRDIQLYYNSQLCFSIHQLSDFLPRWKGVDGQLDRTEFRNTLSYLSLPMNNEEFSKLWNRYDPKGKGYITGRELMQHMGVSISSRPTTTTSTLSSTLSGMDSI